MKPKAVAPMKLSIAVRICMIPIIAFGPISGIAIAVLIYGNPTPQNVSAGLNLRTAATWVSSSSGLDTKLVLTIVGIIKTTKLLPFISSRV